MTFLMVNRTLDERLLVSIVAVSVSDVDAEPKHSLTC